MINNKRILIIGTSWGGGDIPPLFALARGLRKRGNEVLFIGDQQLVKIACGDGDIAIGPLPDAFDANRYRNRWLRDVERVRNSPSSPCPRLYQYDWGDDVYPIISNVIADFRPDAIVCTSPTFYLGTLIRNDLGIPLCFLNSMFYFGPGARRTPDLDFAIKNMPFIRGPIRYWDHMDLAIHAVDSQFDPQPKPKPDHHHWVGPLMWEQKTTSSDEFLNEPGDPWALVSLSLIRQPGEINLGQVAMNALSSQSVRTLLTLGDQVEGDRFDSIPENARVETYVPHSKALQNAALSINHGGHGIVSKSMYYGVPMVIVPMGRDQPGVAARAEALGIARVIQPNDLSEDAMRNAITHVREDPSYMENAKAHSARLQAKDSVATACALIEAL